MLCTRRVRSFEVVVVVVVTTADGPQHYRLSTCFEGRVLVWLCLRAPGFSHDDTDQDEYTRTDQ
jgi:hypothetical protein